MITTNCDWRPAENPLKTHRRPTEYQVYTEQIVLFQTVSSSFSFVSLSYDNTFTFSICTSQKAKLHAREQETVLHIKDIFAYTNTLYQSTVSILNLKLIYFIAYCKNIYWYSHT